MVLDLFVVVGFVSLFPYINIKNNLSNRYSSDMYTGKHCNEVSVQIILHKTIL